MPDQVQNPNINFPGQGSPPVIPPSPVVGAPEAGTNPGPAAPQSADWQNAGGQVEPVPLPKVTDVEPIKPEPVVAAPAQSSPPADIEAGKPAEPNPLFEKPATVAPKAKDEGRSPPAGEAGTKAEGHLKFPKGVIAGIAALVFLVVGLGSGLYLVGQKQDIRPFALTWEEQMKESSATTDRFVKTWGSVEEAKKQWERERDLFEATGGEQNDGLWGGAKEPEVVQQFWDSGVNNKQAAEEERQEVVTVARQAAEEVKQQGASAADAAAAAKAAVQNLGAQGVNPPGGTGVVNGDAGACYGLGDRDLEAKCIADAKGGQYKAGNCRAQDCLGLPNVHAVYCQGPQESADSPRAGEFLTCGPQFTSTGGCGQADVYESEAAYKAGEQPIGFIIDKSNCAPAPPQVTTEEVPPREFPPEPTTPPGATATPTPVTVNAFCSSLVGQVADGAGGWVTKTDAEFSATARPGDRVRFVCTGAKNRGRFTKSAFFINSVLHIDDVVKLAEDQYSVEYAIPAAGALKVESVLLHDTKGWVD